LRRKRGHKRGERGRENDLQVMTSAVRADSGENIKDSKSTGEVDLAKGNTDLVRRQETQTNWVWIGDREKGKLDNSQARHKQRQREPEQEQEQPGGGFGTGK
jgi:hypothetical protein